MIRFIIRHQRYDGECLNALKTDYATIDCEVPELAGRARRPRNEPAD